MKRLAEIEQRAQEIHAMLAGEDEIDMETVQTELRSLADEKKQIEQRMQMQKDLTDGLLTAKKIELPKEERKMSVETMKIEEVLASAEYRSAFFKNLQGKELTDVEKRTLTTAAGSVGAAVPTITQNAIIDKLRQYSILYTRIGVVNVNGNVTLVVANAKNAAAWKAEGTAGTAADDTVTSVTLGGNELIKLVEISAKASAMTIDALESYIVDEIARQMAIAFENAILNGTGSANDQPQGILTGITWVANTNMINWAAAGSVSYDNIVDGLALLPTLYHQNAVFVMSRKTFWSGIKKIKAADGTPLMAYNPQDAVKFSILGYPVLIDDYIADDLILLGDLNYYKWNNAAPITIESSREASFTTGKTVYRGLAVADGKVALSEAFVKISKTGV